MPRYPNTCLRRPWPLAALLLASLAACGSGDDAGVTHELSGRTMGTRFNVQIVALPEGVTQDALGADIRALLEDINAKMSTYDEASEISRFNRYEGDDWFGVSAETATVVAAAQAISEATNGAFDVTVGPLVNLWGFGPKSALDAMPGDAVIENAIAKIGYRKLSVNTESPALRKSEPGLYVDLSAIAKGYGVDRIAALLESRGVTDFLVDIGGELKVKGKNGSGRDWRVAVEDPVQNGEPYTVLEVESGAVATSGNYRNYFEVGGQRFSHTIDPRTGRPVTHSLLSATVIAEDAMSADAWATALIVLGDRAGLRVAEEQGLAVLLLSKGGNELQAASTGPMKPYLK